MVWPCRPPTTKPRFVRRHGIGSKNSWRPEIMNPSNPTWLPGRVATRDAHGERRRRTMGCSSERRMPWATRRRFCAAPTSASTRRFKSACGMPTGYGSQFTPGRRSCRRVRLARIPRQLGSVVRPRPLLWRIWPLHCRETSCDARMSSEPRCVLPQESMLTAPDTGCAGCRSVTLR